MKEAAYKKAMAKIYALLLEATNNKNAPLSDGELCAWNCISDSLQDRISYLNDFENETIECRVIEFKIELESIISVLKEDIIDLVDSHFDNDFKQVVIKGLVELQNIFDDFNREIFGGEIIHAYMLEKK